MRRAIGPDGKRLFKVSEFLTTQQVSSFFSWPAAKARNGVHTEDDIRACEEEIHFNAACQEISSSLQLEHTIVYDQYNIWELVKKGSLKNMKLGLLQLLCEKFELESPAKKVRSKAQYLSLHEKN